MGLTGPGQTRLQIFDVRGQFVRELYRGWEPAGWARHAWSGTDQGGRSLPSGVYLYEIRFAGGSSRGKVALIR